MAKKPLKEPKKQTYDHPGQPTKYEPKYCKMLIEHMASGLSYESFAGVLHVARATLYNWEENGDFLDAKRIGMERNLVFWEKQGVKGLWEEAGKDAGGLKLNSTVWIFNMKNRHKWKDKQEIDLNNNDKDLIQREKLKRMSMEELKELTKKTLEEEE